jgi:hypothetical protein
MHLQRPQTRLERIEGLADGTEQNNTYGKYMKSSHMSGNSSNQSTQLGHLSQLDPIIEVEIRRLQLYPSFII